VASSASRGRASRLELFYGIRQWVFFLKDHGITGIFVLGWLSRTGGVSLSKALAAAEVMFVPNFQAGIALKALGYFNDGDLPSLELSTKKFLARLAADAGDLPEVAFIGTRVEPLPGGILRPLMS
jgi:hypothetical protein